MIVGARIVRTCRSTKESQEQRAMPMHGTHICQSVARSCETATGDVAGVAMATSWFSEASGDRVTRCPNLCLANDLPLMRGQPLTEVLQRPAGELTCLLHGTPPAEGAL